MATITSSTNMRLLEWRLLDRIKVVDFSDGGQSLGDQISGVIGGLHIEPAQLERIHMVILQAVSQKLCNSKTVGKLGSVLIMILSTTESIEGVGWGFFIVEKQATEPGLTTDETTHVLELFLYQERHPQTD